MDQIADLLLFLLPIYAANAVPVVLGGGAPLDFGLKLPDQERLLGDSKTVRGFLAGILAGTIVAGAISLYYPLPFFADQKIQFIAGALASVGTMGGDALGSLIKRRFKVGSGKPFILDSIFFLILSLLFVFPLADLRLYEIGNVAFFVALTLVLHPLTNMIANKAGLKNVPW